jgi:anti-sigma factor RsiW
MISCVNNGTLRSHLDQELPEQEERSVAEHLLACGECNARLALLRPTAAFVATALDSLLPVSAAPPAMRGATPVYVRPRERGNNARLLPWASLAVAGLFVAFAIFTVGRHPNTPQAGSARLAKDDHIQRTEEKRLSTESDHPASAKADCFLPLDNGEPIQMGVVVRLNLPASVLSPWTGSLPSGEIPADVLLDEAGRARAVRFLK